MRFVLLVILCSSFVVAQDDAKTTSATSTKENAKAETEKPTTSAICKKCDCEIEEKTVNCQGLEITKLFSKDEFIAFNNSDVPQDTFRLNNNELTTITEFPKLLIKSLILHGNKINTIDHGAFRNLSILEELDLSSNELTSKILLKEVFEGHYSPSYYEPLLTLRILRLSHNKLHTLDQDVFEHLPNLEVLSLDSNPIMVIDHLATIAISQLTNLKFLDLSNLEVTALPETIFNTQRELTTLNLTGNLLTTIPIALKYAINLTTLYLDENAFSRIEGDNVMPPLTKLEFLSISYTPMKYIGKGAFSQLTSLKTLMCTNNPHLSIIDSRALSSKGKEDPIRLEYPPLKHIYLHNNNISTLDSLFYPHWDALELIDIRHNPWTCDCENQWIISNLLPQIVQKHPTMTKDIICDHPTAMVGKELTELLTKNTKLRCSDKYGHMPEGDGRILVGILIGILIGVPMALAMVFVYKRGCFGLSSNRGAAAYSRAFYKRAEMGDDFHI